MCMDSRVRILLAEANANEKNLISAYLDVPGEEQGIDDHLVDLETVATLDEATLAVKRDRFDVVLLDLNLSDSLGLDTYYQLRDHLHEAAVIILTSLEDSTSAFQAVKAGAQDLIVKHRIDSVSLRRALRYAMERKKRELAEFEIAGAGLLQQSILSITPPRVEGLDMAAHCVPASTVGGDFYDFVRVPDDKFAVVLGDVSGHGLGSAILMAEARGIFRTVAQRAANPGQILTEINRLILSDCVKGSFITMFLAVICPDTWTLRFASAGHEAFLVSPQGRPKERLAGTSPPLGILPNHEYQTAQVVDLAPNDVLFACTDGLTDCYCPQRKHFYGMEGVFSTFAERPRNAAGMLEALFSSVKDYRDGSHDDMTAVVVRAVMDTDAQDVSAADQITETGVRS